MNTRVKVVLFCVTALCFIGCDRVTKDLAKKHLMDKPTISYFHDTLRFLYVENTGAAMGLGLRCPQGATAQGKGQRHAQGVDAVRGGTWARAGPEHRCFLVCGWVRR